MIEQLIDEILALRVFEDEADITGSEHDESLEKAVALIRKYELISNGEKIDHKETPEKMRDRVLLNLYLIASIENIELRFMSITSDEAGSIGILGNCNFMGVDVTLGEIES